MKIAIEFTVEPDEIPLATELLTVLQRITTHIRPSNGPRLFEQLFKQVIHNRSKLEETGQRIRQVLATIVAPEEAAALRADLFQAFQDVALVPDILIHEGALTSLMDTLPAIGEPYVGELLHKLVPHLLAKLSRPRTAAADRVEFFAEAEAFAHVVRLDFIAVSAAVKAVTAMVKGAGTRAAAMTILGKLTELCSDKVRETCDPALLRDLQAALALVTDESLQYDVAYVSEHLLALPATAVVPSAARAAPGAALDALGPGRLRSLIQRPRLTLTGGDVPLLLAIDQQRDIVHTCTEKGTIVSLKISGAEVAHTSTLDKYTGSAMDVHMLDDVLVLATKSRAEGAPAILVYDLAGVGASSGSAAAPMRQLPLKLTWMRPEAKVISAVHAFNRAGNILAAESASKSKTYRINMIDLSGRSSSKDASVVASWEEHEGLISSITGVADAPHLFMTASFDNTVRLWDVRRPGGSVGILGRGGKGASDASVGHTGAVLSVDAASNYAVSCDRNATVLVWDMRKIRTVLGTAGNAQMGVTKPTGTVQQSALKVCIAPDGDTAALVVPGGLRLLRLSTCQHVDVPLPQKRSENSVYLDLRWHIASQRLLLAGQDGIDIFDGDVE